MSGKLVGMVFDHYPSGGSELLLAVKLADNAHDSGTHIFPSVATLAAQTRQSVRTVQYQLKRMVESGWLVLVREAVGGGRGGGFGRPREYRIHPNWIAAHDARIPEVDRPTWPPVQGEVTQESSPATGADGGSHARMPTEEMGAKIAPNKSRKWVQPSAEMGATAIAQMGAIAVAPEPSLTVKEQIPPVSPPRGAPAVDELLAIWPPSRRSKRTRAERALAEVLAAGGIAMVQLVDAARAQSQQSDWQREGGRYVPLLCNWLKDQRWLDGVAGLGASEAWQDSRAGVDARARRLGMRPWDESAFREGRPGAVSYPAFRGQVIERDREQSGGDLGAAA